MRAVSEEIVFALVVYALFGLVYVKMESDLFFSSSFDEEMTHKQAILTVVQQFIHYLRVLLTWPLYMAEDIVLWAEDE